MHHGRKIRRSYSNFLIDMNVGGRGICRLILIRISLNLQNTRKKFDERLKILFQFVGGVV